VAALFLSVVRFDPENPRAVTCDRFVLSKGHAAPLLYAAWAVVGVVPREALVTSHAAAAVRRRGHRIAGSGPRLGLGLGLALGARLAGSDARAFVLLGDGETAEGSVWEAVQLAAHDRVDQLEAIVDTGFHVQPAGRPRDPAQRDASRAPRALRDRAGGDR